jgi:hypothetical protein
MRNENAAVAQQQSIFGVLAGRSSRTRPLRHANWGKRVDLMRLTMHGTEVTVGF